MCSLCFRTLEKTKTKIKLTSSQIFLNTYPYTFLKAYTFTSLSFDYFIKQRLFVCKLQEDNFV